MCPRCHGFLVRDLGFQTITHEGAAYHCVNCGEYIDLTIMRNRSAQHDQTLRPNRYSYGDDSHALVGIGCSVLDRDGVFSLF